MTGSFLNVLVWRLPLMLERRWQSDSALVLNLPDPYAGQAAFNWATPRSHCPACKTPLRKRDLLPVVSFLYLQGRCAHCQTAIPWRYPLVEIANACLWMVCIWHFGQGAAAWVWAIWSSLLFALCLIDADTMLLPDDLTLPLLWGGLLASMYGWTEVPLRDAVWGSVAGYSVLWGMHQLFVVVTGKEGMGGGDFKLLAALGAWLGWAALPVLVVLACVLSLLGTMILQWRHGKHHGQAAPFGPYLGGVGWFLALGGGQAWTL